MIFFIIPKIFRKQISYENKRCSCTCKKCSTMCH
ncbi:hypothetical protein ACFLRN_05205 [Thermoproteota archaeon]